MLLQATEGVNILLKKLWYFPPEGSLDGFAGKAIEEGP
jgi:hypothetical protein